MNVYIPTPLRSYTTSNVVQAEAATLAELFAELDRKFPGIRFRIINEQDQIREHIRIFVNQRNMASLADVLQPDDDVRIIMAISGG
jgi:sulfur-carrier protein